MKLLVLLLLFSCAQTERYSHKEYIVSPGETLESIVEDYLPSFILDDPVQRANAMTKLKMYNTHLKDFPELSEGDKLYLTRPVSPFIPSN